MKKLNIVIMIVLIVSLITSCGIDQIFNNDVSKDNDIIEKPKDEDILEEPKDEPIIDKEKDVSEDIEEDYKEAEYKLEDEEKEVVKKEDLAKVPIVLAVSLPDLKKIEKKAYATVDSLNIRSLGSMKGKVVGVINKGVEIHVFGEKNTWYYVEYAKNKKGWVYSRYIQFTPIKKDKIDTSSLSNKSYNWYFIRNSKHQQPGFGDPHKALLDKYQGISIGDKNKKDIYLTFDNGYENGYTNTILDILKRQKVKVGFFVQGSYIDDNPNIVKRMEKESHLVLNHTDNHPEMPNISSEKLKKEINIVAEKYKKLTGKEMEKFLRPPSGVFSEKTLAETKNLGYRSVFWSMAYRDWLVDDQPGKSVAYNHVIDNIHNGAVILLHSVSKSNTEALEDIIKELKRQGYTFKLLSQYP